MKQILLLLLLLTFFITSCTHKPGSYNVTANYMVIGPGGGFRPPQGTFYYLTNSQLIADTTVSIYNPPADISLFNFNDTMPSPKHAAVKDILQSIPSEILGLNHKEIGISNVAADGGYTDIRTKINGILYDWKFHDNQSTSSPEIQQFVAKAQVVFK